MQLAELKYLDDKIDFNNRVECTPLNWDVVIKRNDWVEYAITDVCDPGTPLGDVGDERMQFFEFNIPMAVYRIEGYNHTGTADGGGKDLYVCPRHEQPSIENLSPFDDSVWDIWSFEIKNKVYRRKDEITCGYSVIIKRNGVEFERFGTRDIAYGAIKAQKFIYDIKESSLPFNFFEVDYQKKIEGYQCKWKGRPCTITRYIEG